MDSLSSNFQLYWYSIQRNDSSPSKYQRYWYLKIMMFYLLQLPIVFAGTIAILCQMKRWHTYIITYKKKLQKTGYYGFFIQKSFIFCSFCFIIVKFLLNSNFLNQSSSCPYCIWYVPYQYQAILSKHQHLQSHHHFLRFSQQRRLVFALIHYRHYPSNINHR